MKNFAEKVYNGIYETNEKGELKQNVRNAFKSDLMKAFQDFLKANDLDSVIVSDGVAVQFANAELGSITVVFDGTVKGQDYDLVSENQDYLDKMAEKVAKAEKLAREKALKIATQKAEKELKPTKQQAKDLHQEFYGK